MQTDEILHLLSRDPLMCRTYGVVAKDCLPEIINTYPIAIVCNTHDADQSGEHWIAMYVDSKRHGDYFDPYGLQPQHIEFTNFMNEHSPLPYSRPLVVSVNSSPLPYSRPLVVSVNSSLLPLHLHMLRYIYIRLFYLLI